MKSSPASNLWWHCVLPLLLLFEICISAAAGASKGRQLKFNEAGQFKILQVADMHYANGGTTTCLDVLPSQYPYCSDLNTTAFLYRVIKSENPDFVVFTGDNIFGSDSDDPTKSVDLAFAPVTTSFDIPWAAVLGNHDQETGRKGIGLTREELMKHIITLNNTLSQVNPPEAQVISGFGNYNLEVGGIADFENKSVLNLYFLDSGDYSTMQSVSKYDWIKLSQQVWFQETSARLHREYVENSDKNSTGEAAPGIAYFHIPLPEFATFTTPVGNTSFDHNNYTGEKMEEDGSAAVNSGFFTSMVEAGDVKAVFVGHAHKNDFCGRLHGINLCYAGGFGYHAYGKAGWPRRARVMLATLEQSTETGWGEVNLIKTWKRLDDQRLSLIDEEILWTKKTDQRS